MKKIVTAAFIIIGDEILSGRTKDENLNFLACALGENGVSLKEARVVPDIEQEIIDAVNAARKKYDYIFTSGGVGTTHDDITIEAIAKAFGDNLVKNEEAANLLASYYGSRLTEIHMKMAYLPSRAKLIENDILSPSGFVVENVFVLAGVPRIFRAMFEGIKKEIVGGAKIKSREIKISLPESSIAKVFADLQKKYPQVIMGSYPSETGASLVFRSAEYEFIDISLEEMVKILQEIDPKSIVATS
jgi:molybdenum cofactor synthesis domain-containing protein